MWYIARFSESPGPQKEPEMTKIYRYTKWMDRHLARKVNTNLAEDWSCLECTKRPEILHFNLFAEE